MTIPEKPRVVSAKPPQLQQGDVLTRAEFERRYAAMPHIKKAELIEGIVYMATPVRADVQGIPHVKLATLLRVYATKHPSLVIDSKALTAGDLATALARLS